MYADLGGVSAAAQASSVAAMEPRARGDGPWSIECAPGRWRTPVLSPLQQEEVEEGEIVMAPPEPTKPAVKKPAGAAADGAEDPGPPLKRPGKKSQGAAEASSGPSTSGTIARTEGAPAPRKQVPGGAAAADRPAAASEAEGKALADFVSYTVKVGPLSLSNAIAKGSDWLGRNLLYCYGWPDQLYKPEASTWHPSRIRDSFPPPLTPSLLLPLALQLKDLTFAMAFAAARSFPVCCAPAGEAIIGYAVHADRQRAKQVAALRMLQSAGFLVDERAFDGIESSGQVGPVATSLMQQAIAKASSKNRKEAAGGQDSPRQDTRDRGPRAARHIELAPSRSRDRPKDAPLRMPRPGEDDNPDAAGHSLPPPRQPLLAGSTGGWGPSVALEPALMYPPVAEGQGQPPGLFTLPGQQASGPGRWAGKFAARADPDRVSSTQQGYPAFPGPPMVQVLPPESDQQHHLLQQPLAPHAYDVYGNPLPPHQQEIVYDSSTYGILPPPQQQQQPWQVQQQPWQAQQQPWQVEQQQLYDYGAPMPPPGVHEFDPGNGGQVFSGYADPEPIHHGELQQPQQATRHVSAAAPDTAPHGAAAFGGGGGGWDAPPGPMRLVDPLDRPPSRGWGGGGRKIELVDKPGQGRPASNPPGGGGGSGRPAPHTVGHPPAVS